MRRVSSVVLCLLSCPAAALASEGGTQSYPIGVNTAANGTAPPPGTLEYFNYGVVNWNDSFRGPGGRSEIPGFRLNAQVDASRLLYTWKNIRVGPFHYVTGLVVPFGHASISVPGRRVSKTGILPIDVQNYLAYASPDYKLFLLFGTEAYIPVGNYDKQSLLNLNSNYLTIAPNASVTWNPSRKVELTASAIVEFKTRNKATDYRSGKDFDIDYAVNVRPFAKAPNLGLGIQGYFYKQFTDDVVNGRRAPNDGNRGREFGIGPQLRWDIPFGAFIVKYQHEFAVENRPRGGKAWLQFALPLAGRPGAPRRSAP